MAAKRGNPTGRIGNYAQQVDTVGMDPDMQAMMTGTKMDKTESSYVAGAKNKSTATEAVKRARKANKQPLLRPED